MTSVLALFWIINFRESNDSWIIFPWPVFQISFFSFNSRCFTSFSFSVFWLYFNMSSCLLETLSAICSTLSFTKSVTWVGFSTVSCKLFILLPFFCPQELSFYFLKNLISSVYLWSSYNQDNLFSYLSLFWSYLLIISSLYSEFSSLALFPQLETFRPYHPTSPTPKSLFFWMR